VVGGFTEGKGSRQRVGALLLGAYRNGKLHYFGHSGSGFSEKGIDDALQRMKPLSIDRSPFDNPPKVKEKIHWIKPKSVHWISYIASAVEVPRVQWHGATREHSLSPTRPRSNAGNGARAASTLWAGLFSPHATLLSRHVSHRICSSFAPCLNRKIAPAAFAI
jgi:hypothetical protein